MGLFKTQKSINEELFFAICKQYQKKFFELSTVSDEISYYCALLNAASSLACHMLEIDKSLRKAWGKGSPAQAIAICGICVQPMISIWLSYTDAQMSYPEGERQDVGKTTISNMLNVLGTYSDKKVEHFLKLDLQYVYDHTISENKRISMYYIDLFLSKLAAELGYQNYIDWDKQTFPVKYNADFCFINPNNPYFGFGYDLKSRMSTIMAIPQAGVAMLESYKYFAANIDSCRK